jgi:hypothetical protein
LLAVLGLSSAIASGEDYKGVNHFICASASVMECVPVHGCERVAADAVNVPRFIEVDIDKKTLSARLAGGERRTSPIERSEFVDGKLMLQGVEDGDKEQRDGLGWTMSVAQDSGDMVLTGSGDNVAFVVFGACTAL